MAQTKMTHTLKILSTLQTPRSTLSPLNHIDNVQKRNWATNLQFLPLLFLPFALSPHGSRSKDVSSSIVQNQQPHNETFLTAAQKHPSWQKLHDCCVHMSLELSTVHVTFPNSKIECLQLYSSMAVNDDATGSSSTKEYKWRCKSLFFFHLINKVRDGKFYLCNDNSTKLRNGKAKSPTLMACSLLGRKFFAANASMCYCPFTDRAQQLCGGRRTPVPFQAWSVCRQASRGGGLPQCGHSRLP